MSLRRLEILQWTGLLLGALAFTAAHVVGFGISQAECAAAGRHWGISNDVWLGAGLAAAALCVVAAAVAAGLVVFRTREESYESPPAPGRIRFLAIAAVAANLIFLMIIVLDLLGTLSNVTCRQG
ncbi:MAG TPA: hypothetical protein VI142_01885 [Gaiellaceae bacterium]